MLAWFEEDSLDVNFKKLPKLKTIQLDFWNFTFDFPELDEISLFQTKTRGTRMKSVKKLRMDGCKWLRETINIDEIDHLHIIETHTRFKKVGFLRGIPPFTFLRRLHVEMSHLGKIHKIVPDTVSCLFPSRKNFIFADLLHLESLVVENFVHSIIILNLPKLLSLTLIGLKNRIAFWKPRTSKLKKLEIYGDYTYACLWSLFTKENLECLKSSMKELIIDRSTKNGKKRDIGKFSLSLEDWESLEYALLRKEVVKVKKIINCPNLKDIEGQAMSKIHKI